MQEGMSFGSKMWSWCKVSLADRCELSFLVGGPGDDTYLRTIDVARLVGSKSPYHIHKYVRGWTFVKDVPSVPEFRFGPTIMKYKVVPVRAAIDFLSSENSVKSVRLEKFFDDGHVRLLSFRSSPYHFAKLVEVNSCDADARPFRDVVRRLQQLPMSGDAVLDETTLDETTLDETTLDETWTNPPPKISLKYKSRDYVYVLEKSCRRE